MADRFRPEETSIGSFKSPSLDSLYENFADTGRWRSDGSIKFRWVDGWSETDSTSSLNPPYYRLWRTDHRLSGSST